MNTVCSPSMKYIMLEDLTLGVEQAGTWTLIVNIKNWKVCIFEFPRLNTILTCIQGQMAELGREALYRFDLVKQGHNLIFEPAMYCTLDLFIRGAFDGIEASIGI
jgi:hypothetical protein